jgi:acyl dehydratase
VSFPTFESVSIGDELPPLVVPLTRTLILATAIASRDYQEVHHDHEVAQSRGSQDIIMNILTTNGFVGRFITDWAGPDALIRSVKVRLGAPNYPGDTMTMTGAVTATAPSDSPGPWAGTVSITVRGANRVGDHVNATVDVALLGSAPR